VAERRVAPVWHVGCMRGLVGAQQKARAQQADDVGLIGDGRPPQSPRLPDEDIARSARRPRGQLEAARYAKPLLVLPQSEGHKAT
jgi:hypothetical protein